MTNKSFDNFSQAELSLSLIPLGGLGEIGLNCMALLSGDDILVVDAGLMFPDASLPGVDLLIPDFDFLAKNRDKIRGIILTHGHEDHIGALAFLLKQVNTTVYGTKLTLALATDRLSEYDVPLPTMISVKARDSLTLGAFQVEFIQVSHSILDSLALAVTTPVGVIIHTGDFKIDLGAGEADRLDLFKFAEYGEKGVLALLSDSTNSEVPGFTISEAEVGRSLTKIFKETPGRIILACFASSLARIRQLILAASLTGRKLAFDGKSMLRNVELAQDLGYLKMDSDTVIDLSDSQALDDQELVIVVTGSQGEPMSALARMAGGEHRKVSVKAGDTIIFSARAIPGNERAITQLMDRFHRLGAQVLDNRHHKIHASGHAQAEELKLMLNLTRPTYLIPVHGEMRQLIRHADLAREQGLAQENLFVLENGQRLILFENRPPELGQPVTTGRKLVDGNRLGEPDDPVIRRRHRLAGSGLIMVSLVISDTGDTLLSEPLVSIEGLHYENEPDLTPEVTNLVEKSFSLWQEENCNNEKLSETDLGNLRDTLKKNIRQFFRQNIGRKPNVWSHVSTIEPQNLDK